MLPHREPFATKPLPLSTLTSYLSPLPSYLLPLTSHLLPLTSYLISMIYTSSLSRFMPYCSRAIFSRRSRSLLSEAALCS